MKRTHLQARFILLLKGLSSVFLIMAISIALFSCSSTKEVISWNVELKEAEIPISDRCDPDVKLNSVKSPEQPLFIPETEERDARVKVTGLPCSEGEDAPVYEIPVSRIKRITYVSDPLMPPSAVAVEDLMPIEGCCRKRDGFWIFDKFEIRGAIGYRGREDSVVYPTPTGDEVYKSSFINFDRGGSSLTLGFEIAGMWNVHFIDKSGKLQMGILTGIWPVDGSLFIPVGLNARYTLNQHPSKFSGNCNTWYLYGNIGLPFDFNTEAPVFGKSAEYQRLFYGLGIGYDWAISCDLDFSVDLGYRKTNLPLPQVTCCPTTPDENRNPYRDSDILLLRFGLTF